jgi:hypothetical protein
MELGCFVYLRLVGRVCRNRDTQKGIKMAGGTGSVTSLPLDCPIWTEDQDFFGSGVATWTTGTVEVYLGGDSE